LVALFATLAAQRPKDRPALKAPRAPAEKGMPRAGKKDRIPRTPVDRFNRMPPEERQKALEKLPPERRKRLEEQLDQYNHLTPEQRRQERLRYQAFNQQFPPDKQNQARRLFRQFGELPAERQGPLRKEFESLRALPDAERRARINSDEFRSKYDSHEQRILRDLSGLVSK
jgi:Protein of unknown function (DUF3106)